MSRRGVIHFISVTSMVVAAASCTSERTVPMSAPAGSLAAASTTSCDFRALQTDARTYFGSGNQPVFDVIRQMSTACKAGDVAGTIDYGFDVLAWIAHVTDAGAQQGTPADGATLTLDVLAFATSLDPNVPTATALTQALSSRGLFEVRGKNVVFLASNEYVDPIYSRNAIENQVPAWGAMPGPSGNWSTGPRFLAYGFPLFLGKGVTNEQPIAFGFDFNRYPGRVFPSAIVTGVCVQAANTDRIQHDSANTQSGTQFLPFATLSCPDSLSTLTPVSASASADVVAPSAITRAIRDVLNLFAPSAAWASGGISGVGGLGSTWSPHIAVNLVAVTLSIASGFPIADGVISRPIVDTAGNPIRIAVRAAGGSGLAGVAVTLVVYNNSGTNVALSLDGTTYASTVTATTNALGIADFTGLRVNKAGGYILVATGSYDGIPGSTFTSNLFNMQNK